MKKAIKAIFIVLLFFVIFPALAGAAVMALWNNIITGVCGFSVISYWQGVGLFIMGQLLTGGFLLALFFIVGGMHAIFHHHGEWREYLHNMTDEQRRAFIERRRREHFGFHYGQNNIDNAE